MPPAPGPVPSDSSPSLALKARFGAWVAVVGAVQVGPLWSRAGLPVVDLAWNLAGVTAMLVLLQTTPEGAIRLPRAASAVVVIFGSFWLLVGHGRPGLIVAALGLLVALQSGRRTLGGSRVGPSLWTMTPFLWHAILWVGTRPGLWFAPLWPVEGAGALAFFFSGMIALILAMMCLDRPGRVAKSAGWAFWLAAAAATAALAMAWPPPT